jgi:hypothetical protein
MPHITNKTGRSEPGEPCYKWVSVHPLLLNYNQHTIWCSFVAVYSAAINDSDVLWRSLKVQIISPFRFSWRQFNHKTILYFEPPSKWHPEESNKYSRINRIYLSVLTQQIVVLLISSQNKISRRCLVDISLMSIHPAQGSTKISWHHLQAQLFVFKF